MKKCKPFHDLMYLAANNELNEADQVVFNQHLELCPSCKTTYDKFRGTLDMLSQREAPDPGEDYWESFAARIEEKVSATSNGSSTSKPVQHFWLNTGIRVLKVAALVMIGVMLGYVLFGLPPAGDDSMADSKRGNNIVRMTASAEDTDEYLESAKVFLLGIVNLDTENFDKSAMDFSMHREYSKNMIQRTAALRDNLKGRENQRVIELLNELEMIFLQLANYEQDNDLEAVELIRGGVEDQALLLKIDVEKLILNNKQKSKSESLSSEI